MANKKRHSRARPGGLPMPADAGPVGPREPCPCGSGARYKNCHGRHAHAGAGVPNARPFAGVAFERELVALRELVPSAVLPVTLTGQVGPGAADRRVQLASVLPLAWPALVRPDGAIWVGLQTQNPTSLDPGRDLVATLRAALGAAPGSGIETVPAWAEDDLALAQVFDSASTAQVDVRADFGWWADGLEADPNGELDRDEIAASLERANQAAHPSARLAAAPAAYWCQIEGRFHLRWVRDEPEEQLLDALARLIVDGQAGVGAGSRLVGSFRTCGLVVPVWDLAPGTQPAELEEPVALDAALSAALAGAGTPLTGAARAARSHLNSRQVTLR